MTIFRQNGHNFSKPNGPSYLKQTSRFSLARPNVSRRLRGVQKTSYNLSPSKLKTKLDFRTNASEKLQMQDKNYGQ